MSSPIGNNQGVNVDVPITPTTTTTTGGIGEHSVTTTATGQTSETATTTGSVATGSLQQTGGAGSVNVTSSDGNVSGVTVNGESVKISTSGNTQATSTADKTESASSSVLFFKESSGTERSETLDAINEDLGGPTEAAGGRRDSVSSTSSESSLDSLYSLRGSEMSETEAAQQVGPGGLPQNAIPSYDPTSKASIIEFLKNPNVQGKMQTKGGHYVYVDEARSSFIFVKNGDWSTAESIKVTNGRTKADLTNPKTLEDCIAKFCVGFKELESSWNNVVKPGLENKSGATGDYSHLILNMKFKTAVVYGPWNTKENSTAYTPSAWRRGAELKVNKEIFGDVGGLKPLSWQSTPRPTDADFHFDSETSKPQPQPQPQPYPPFQMPSINININNTNNNNVGGGDSNTKGADNVDTSNKTDETNKTEETNEADETNETESTDGTSETSQSEDVVDGKIEEEGNGADNEAPPPPPSGGDRINANILPSNDLKTLLLHVRQHLDTVYDENGNHHTGSQDLGNVVRTSENGTWVPTVRLAEGSSDTARTEGPQGPDTDDGGVGGTGGGNNDVQETPSDDDSSKTKGTDETDSSTKTSDDSGKGKGIGGDDNGAELMDILSRVRKHLNVVYPGGGNEGPVNVNRNLGEVIQEAEAGRADSGTFATGESGSGDEGFVTATVSGGIAKTAQLVKNESANPSDGSGQSVSGKKGPPVPPKPSNLAARVAQGGAGTSRATSTPPQPANTATKMMGKQFGLQTSTRDLLKEVRGHLDNVYPTGGRGQPQNVGSSLGSVVSRFREETGSGGILHTETVRTEGQSNSTSSTNEQINAQGGAVKALAKMFENASNKNQ
ncbi:type III secretion system actin-recruiting effector Tarp [Chlamydiifrater phoenicopteri]|uniref:type III secretion system actin-recruiting effector Tarp n=1 Tax=Chlamydiifrater phoenicopteri TaxID=2681469 RepID=UPI001BD0F11D|nr:type III secretion system actin-recruiting effector Tarp [Chlamydiifrater phoenicopteri]